MALLFLRNSELFQKFKLKKSDWRFHGACDTTELFLGEHVSTKLLSSIEKLNVSILTHFKSQ